MHRTEKNQKYFLYLFTIYEKKGQKRTIRDKKGHESFQNFPKFPVFKSLFQRFLPLFAIFSVSMPNFLFFPDPFGWLPLKGDKKNVRPPTKYPSFNGSI